MLRRILVGLVLLACVVGEACTKPAHAPGVEDVFADRTVRIVVGFAAGGGYDLHARVFANHLSRHLPGQPTVIVESLPGAGGLIAANYLARQARPDGLTIGFLGLHTVLPQLIGEPGVQYDARRFRVIGSPAFEDVDVCLMSRASGISLSNWRNRRAPPRIGVTTRGSANHARAMLLSAALDLPIRPVVGYKGTSDVRLAMESGEVDGTCVGLHAYETTFEASGKYAIAFQSGDDPSPLLREAPSAARLVHDAHGRALLDLLATLRALDRYYVVPPGTPRIEVDLLRAAFDETMADDQFLAEARVARLEIRPSSWAEIESRVASVLSLPADRREEVSALLKEQPAP